MARIRRTRTKYISALNDTNSIAFSNAEKTELVVYCLRSQFKFNQEIVNPKITVFVNSQIKQILNTKQDNTLSFCNTL